MKVIKVSTDSVFKGVGLNILKVDKNGIEYAIVRDSYRYKEPVFEGTKKQCEEFIKSL